MKFSMTICAACLLAGILQLKAQQGTELSKAEVKALVRDAKTHDQYQALATYYRSQEKMFRAKAAAAGRELEHALAARSGSTKFPSRVDMARSSRDYYLWKANTMAAQAGKYEPAAAAAAPPSLTESEKMLLGRIEQLETELRELRH